MRKEQKGGDGMNGAMLANRSAADRNKTDYYRTPPEVTAALLGFLEEHGMLHPSDCIWEPACGTGEMAVVMLKRGYTVACSDLYQTDFLCGEEPTDFLEAGMPEGVDWIITNPPFSQAEKFIRRALEHRKPCAFLLKSQFWHARGRLALFREHPPAYVLPLTWRPDFLWGEKSGSPTMECIWTVWYDRDYITGYIPLERPKVEVMK